MHNTLVESVVFEANALADAPGKRLTQLAVQKILYFAHAEHLMTTGEPLVPGGFDAWKLGPVSATVYADIKHFKTDFLPVPATAPVLPATPRASIVKAVYLARTLSTEALVQYTHDSGLWAQAYANRLTSGSTHIADADILAWWPQAVWELALDNTLIEDAELLDRLSR